VNLAREQVLQHLYAIHKGMREWRKSRAALLAEGSDVVPLVIEVLEVELNRADGDVYIVSYQHLLRLAELLAQLKDPRGLTWLLRVSRQTNEHTFYRQALKALEQRGSEEDIQALIEVMQFTHLRWLGLPFKIKLQPHELSQVAKALVRIAERNPDPELQKALPLLRYRLTAPVEFIGLHKRLKVALGQWKDLPLIADAPLKVEENLPLPADEEVSRG